MKALFPQSIDFNQMLVFSVFGHLVMLTIVLFLPKPLEEAKAVVPAFIVSLVETSLGNKLAAQKKTIGNKKPPIKKIKPKANKLAAVKRVVKKQVVKKKVPHKPNKILAALKKLDKKTAAVAPIPAKSMFEQLDQLALLEPSQKTMEKPKRKNLVLEETLRELEQLKDKKIDRKKEISSKPMPESLLEDFKEFKMEGVVKKKDIKKLPDPNEEKMGEEKTAASVFEKRNLLRELDKLAKLKLADKNKGKEQIPKGAVEEKESKDYDSVLEKLESLTVESSKVKVEVSGAKFDTAEFQSSLRTLPDSPAGEAPVAKLETSKFQSSLRTLPDSPAGEAPVAKLETSKFQSSLRTLPDSLGNVSSNGVEEPHISFDKEGTLAADIQSLYSGLVQEKIYKNWRDPLAERHSKEAIISFHIFPKGNIDKPFIKQSSGVELLDTLAVAAVHDSVPFPPFPKDLKKPNLFLSIYFKYVPKDD